jgi:hypothetical protein
VGSAGVEDDGLAAGEDDCAAKGSLRGVGQAIRRFVGGPPVDINRDINLGDAQRTAAPIRDRLIT